MPQTNILKLSKSLSIIPKATDVLSQPLLRCVLPSPANRLQWGTGELTDLPKEVVRVPHSRAHAVLLPLVALEPLQGGRSDPKKRGDEAWDREHLECSNPKNQQTSKGHYMCIKENTTIEYSYYCCVSV